MPASLAADWLTSVWDQNAGIYASGQAAAITEEAAGAWLKDLLNIPAAASFALVTGCQMAHVTCLAAARYAVLKAKGWDVHEQGLAGGPPIRVLSGEDRHGSVARALRLLGLGKSSAIDMRPDVLEAALLQDPERPTIVLLQAGELNTGVYDSFAELIPIAHKHKAWVHVDGAFGLWAAASPQLRHLLNGCEQADSWATDGHKWLNVPYDCGYAFVRDTRGAPRQHVAPGIVSDPRRRSAGPVGLESRNGRAAPAASRPMRRSGSWDDRALRSWWTAAALTPAPWCWASARCPAPK